MPGREAKFVDMFHATTAIAPPESNNSGKGPYLMTDGFNPIGMMLGEWNSYQCFKGAALTSLYFPGLEIFSGGGITKSSQVIQAIMFGARAVELCPYYGTRFKSGDSMYLTPSIETLQQKMASRRVI